MGALQLGLPSPVMLPEEWDLLIIDLKDCFFTIPLHPDDAEWFTFSPPPGNHFQQARQSHAFLHQPARMLAKQFDLPLSDAQGIVKACPDC
ncbi:POK25 protein, partial [Haliaeetus albicilla]|nr:POK25 protein [Haliaeetus albicilla]